MNIKEIVSEAISNGFAPVPRFKDKESGEWKLRKFINKDTGEYGYPLEHKAWDAKMPVVSLVLLDCVLIDLDANKENCTHTIEELKEQVCELFDIDEFDLDMALFQENEKGDSIHYMFKLPGDVNFADIAQSNDGKIIKNVDFKTGRQLVHLKEGKTIHWCNVENLTELSTSNIDKIFKKSKSNNTPDDFKSTTETTNYGKGALRGINNDATLFVEEGGRNFSLSKATVAIYELVAGGEISEQDAHKEICQIVLELEILDEPDTETTIEYNKKKGMGQPKSAPNKNIEKEASVVDYKIDDVVKDRIKDEFKRGALGVEFEVDAVVIKLILKNTYYTCAAKTFFKMFNSLGQVIRVSKNDIATMIIDNFGQPIKNYNELSMAVEAAAADNEITAAQKKQITSLPVNIIVKILMEFQQRERITQCVDIFADNAHMDIRSNEVIESLKYVPINIEHEMYNEEIVQAYEAHFPELYDVLDMIIAARFASSRKKCYLWIKAESDWGKDLFRVCLGERAMEMSMTQIGKAIKGETVSVHMDDIVGTFALCVNEFSHINGELKQIEDKIVIAPKYMNQSTIPTFAKLFFSADDVDSLVGEYGVESQYANRFSTLTYDGSIDELPIFHQVGQYTFTQTLKTHVANYINGRTQAYIDMGIREASVNADRIVSSFHKKHGIASKVGNLDGNIDALADTVARYISMDNDGFKVIHDGEPVYTRARTAIQEVLFKIGGKSEAVKLNSKWKKVLELISIDGVKVYKIDGKPVKGFKLKCEQIEDF